MFKTPLRYPGGKTRGVKQILEWIPSNCEEFCSPFLGGGSLEVAYAQANPDCKVHAYDVYVPLVWFWQALLTDPALLAKEADKLRVSHDDFKMKSGDGRGLLNEDFINIRKEVKSAMGQTAFSFENAAKVYAINRSGYSGATFSGGYSKRAAYARFTESSIERVRNFNVPNMSVGMADFRVSIHNHPNAFLYLDPPYNRSDKKDVLYGTQGSTHKAFDHDGLYECLKDRKGWVLSYNKCDWVLDKYKDYAIVDAQWAYGMTNVQKKKFKIMKEKLKEIKERLNEDKLFFDKYNELHDLREHWVSSASLLEQKVEGELKKAQEESSEILILSPMA
jgi:DNA adenine methylase